jgi:hypothetical protein
VVQTVVDREDVYWARHQPHKINSEVGAKVVPHYLAVVFHEVVHLDGKVVLVQVAAKSELLNGSGQAMIALNSNDSAHRAYNITSSR